ncbi:hypothetical protein D3C76_154630 [compost metagenome]
MKQTYIGSKIVFGQPMTRGDYNAYRGWDTPERENAEDEGYLVEYPGSEPNHPAHEHYISWSPRSVFDPSHVAMGDCTHFPPFAVRMIGERNVLAASLKKLQEYLAQENKPISEQSIQLLTEKAAAMQTLLDVTNKTLDALDLGFSVDCEATVLLDLANDNRKDLMGLVLATGVEMKDICSTIIGLKDIQILDIDGQVIPDTSVEVEHLTRGFAVSGSIGEDLYGVAVDSQRGVASVNSSFVEEGKKLSMRVQLGSANRVPGFI